MTKYNVYLGRVDSGDLEWVGEYEADLPGDAVELASMEVEEWTPDIGLLAIASTNINGPWKQYTYTKLQREDVTELVSV